MNRLKKRFINIRIRNKLLLINLFTVVLPLLILYLFVSDRLINLTSQQFMNSSRQTLDQTAGYISHKLTGASSMSNIAVFDPEKYDIISQNPDNYSLQDQIFDAWKLTNFVNSLKFIDPSLRVQMYVKDELYYAKEEVLFHPLSRLLTNPVFKSMVAKNEPLIWCSGKQIDPVLYKKDAFKSLTVVRRLIDLNVSEKTLAAIRIDVPIVDIEYILSKAIVTKGSGVWLVNSDGQALASSFSEANIEPVEGEFHSMMDVGLREISIGNKEYLSTSIEVANTPLYMISVFPRSAPMQQSNKVRIEFLFIILGVMAGVLLVSLQFTQRISSRLQKISERMHWVQNGIMEPINVNVDGDEIVDLARSYNFMIDQICELADESYNNGREALKQEMRTLQGQINPHFLYNMLDLINLSALEKGMTDLAELVRMLAKFYRLGLNRGRETVTIRDELEHVSLYFKMQNRRFGDRIRLEIDVAEEILTHKILKIVLQPIIENSVLHGILSQRDGTGTIWISSYISESHINMTIKDDGAGIKSDNLSSLLDKEGSGYGLYNVNRRLCIFYGNESGLEVKSIQGCGTTVSFTIPIDKELIQ